MPRKNQVGNALNSLRTPESARNKGDKEGESGGVAEGVEVEDKTAKEVRDYDK